MWAVLVTCYNAMFRRRLPEPEPEIVSRDEFSSLYYDELPASATPSEGNLPSRPSLVDNVTAYPPSPASPASPPSSKNESHLYLRGAKRQNASEECPICLGAPTEIVASPNCGHWYHPECIIDWLDRSNDRGCPICGQTIDSQIIVVDTDDGV